MQSRRAALVLLAALVCSAHALAPLVVFRPHPVLRRAASPATPVAAPRRAAGPTMFLGPVKALVSIPTLYALFSVNEYATHRWCQHVAKLLRKRPLFLKDGRRNLIKIK